MKSFALASHVPALVFLSFASLATNACGNVERRDDESDGTSESALSNSIAGPPSTLHFDCTQHALGLPPAPHATKLTIDVNVTEGTLAYRLVPHVLTLFPVFAKTATTAPEDVAVPVHSVSATVSHGAPRTRTVGMSWLDIVAHGAFVGHDGGPTRAPNPSHRVDEGNVTIHFEKKSTTVYELYWLESTFGSVVDVSDDAFACHVVPAT